MSTCVCILPITTSRLNEGTSTRHWLKLKHTEARIMLHTLSRPVLAAKGSGNHSAAQQGRRPRASTNLVVIAAKSSTCFSTKQNTNADLSRALPVPSTSLGGTKAARQNRPRKGNIHAAPSSDDHPSEHGPLDKHLIKLLKQMSDPKDYMPLLRTHLTLYRTLRDDGWKFDEKYDAHVIQLSQVIEQLEKTGECVIGGKIIRP